MRKSEKPTSSVKVLFALLALAAARAVAQNGPDNDANGAPGFTNSVFHSGQIDSINLYNGQLTIPIALGPSYPIGPKLRMQLVLTYNSRVDDFGRPSTQSQFFYYKPLVGNPALPIGWELTLGAIKPCKHGSIPGVCYIGPDGSEHMFDLGAKTGDGSQFYLKGTGPYDMWDADGNHYVFDWHVSGFDDPTTNYTHDFGRGRDGWYLGSVEDPFGNAYQVSYYSGVATPLWAYASNDCGSAWGMLNPSAGKTWIPKDITLSSGGVVHVSAGAVNGVNGMIKTVSFPELVDGASVTKTWTLAYAGVPEPYSRSCVSPSTVVANLPQLAQLQLPADLAGAPAYQFTYVYGLLDTITLPTVGSISYCFGEYVFFHASSGSIEPGCPGMHPDATDALVTRSSSCGSPIEADPAPRIPGRCTPDNSARWVQTQRGVVRRRETLGGTQNDTTYVQYAFPFGESGSADTPAPAQSLTVVVSPPTDRNGDGGRRRARALLFETATDGTIVAGPADPSVPGDRVGVNTEERVFETDPTTGGVADPPCTDTPSTDSDFCASKAVRVIRRTYEYDSSGVPGGNRRLTREKTTYGASTCSSCPFHQAAFTLSPGETWEGNGRHYNVETHTGTLGGDARTVTTDWTPLYWSSGPPAGSPVLANLFHSRRTEQGASVREEYYEFETASSPPTGFLKGSFVYDPGTYGSAGSQFSTIVFLNCRYDDGAGNVGAEFTATYPGYGSLPIDPCANVFPTLPVLALNSGDAFARVHTWLHGELLTSRWVDRSPSIATFKFRDYTRDATTGWVTSSRDTAGRETGFTYDSLGRVSQIVPPSSGELKTWVCYEGPNDTTAYRAAGKLACPVASSGAVTTWEHYRYDGLGRMIREQRLQPGSAIEKRFTLFDGPGNAYFSSEWVTDGTSETITRDLATTCAFSGGTYGGRGRPSSAPGTYRMCFDPLGRPQQVVGPKMSSLVTVDRSDDSGNPYSDIKEAARTWCVNGTFANLTTPTCSAGGISSTTTIRKDAFGRVASAIEPTGDPTNYTYDVNGRLTAVTQGAQGRTFAYDDNGFLRMETTPEGGTVWSDAIGSLGNVLRQKQADGLVAVRTFDFAGRMLEEDAPAGTKFVVNCYDGAAACVDGSTGFAGGSYPGGKLTRRYGYNWIPTVGPIVDEKFTYGDAGGRLSQLETSVGNGDLVAGPSSGWTQSWSYGNLGLAATHNHPRSSGTFGVTYAYANGLPVTVSSGSTSLATSVTYNPAAAVGSWIAGASGVTAIITQDGSMLPRPSRIQAKKGVTTLFDTGTYSYDGAGNILAQSDGTHGGSFTYDNCSRILSSTYGTTTKAFSYDRWGNLLSNGALSFQVDGHNHMTAGGSTATVGYDGRGNMASYNTDTMSWDSLDRLYRNQNASSDWVFLHGGSGERVAKFPGASSVLRREMARLITEANKKAGKSGWVSAPDPCSGSSFTNPPCSDPDAGYIQSLYNHGVGAGCSGTDFCPDTAVNRAQMAVFVVKGYRADGAPAPSCTGIFSDVPCSGSPWSAYAPYIEQLSRDNVTAGCGGSSFCPGNPVTSWQILVWMSKTPAVPGGVAWGTVYHPVPRGSIYTLRDEQNRVVTEATGGSSGASSATLAVTRDNAYLGNLLIASNAAGAWTYNVSDHLGSPRVVWNSTGTVVETHKHWPYGEDTNTTAPNQHLAFHGMERNDAVSQYFDHARTHQYELGRFLSPDSIGGNAPNAQSWNRYAFALSDPLRFVDQDGRFAVPWHIAITFAAAWNNHMGFKASARLAWQTAAVDWRRGSQGLDASSANIHAMRGSDQGATAGLIAIAGKAIRELSSGDLPAAIHTAEDYPPKGHADKTWTGFALNQATYEHVLGDLFPSPQRLLISYELADSIIKTSSDSSTSSPPAGSPVGTLPPLPNSTYARVSAANPD